MGFTPFTGTAGALQAYQFTPETYGAAGNGQLANDVATNGTAVITSPTIAADPAAAGKFIMINGGNGATVPVVVGKIVSVAGSNVTLNVTCGATLSGLSAVWGSDDTAAFNSMQAAMFTYATVAGAAAGSGNYVAQAILGPKLYCLASGPTQSGNGSSTPTFNSQIPLSFPNANGSTRKYRPEFIGVGYAGQCQFFESTIPNLQGTVLVSMVLAPGTGGTAPFGAQSVIGGPSAAAGFTGNFANVCPMLRGITICTGALAQQIGADFRFCAGAYVDNCSMQAFASVFGGGLQLNSMVALGTFTSGNSIGLYMPIATNNDDCNVTSLAVEGFTFGIAFNEHFNAQRLALIYCNIGAFLNPSGSPTHGARIDYMSCEATNIAFQAAATGGGNVPLTIGLMDNEAINTRDIDDANNDLEGEIHWAAFDQTVPRVNGGGNLRVINDRQARGHVASPTFVLGTPLLNPFWHDVFITVTGGTVTGISLDGTATGLTSGTFLWRTGGTMTIAGSVLPTVTTWVT